MALLGKLRSLTTNPSIGLINLRAPFSRFIVSALSARSPARTVIRCTVKGAGMEKALPLTTVVCNSGPLRDARD